MSTRTTVPVTATAPPLGLRPRFVVVLNRIDEVSLAIARYETAGMEVPEHWRNEHAEHMRWLLEYHPHLVTNKVTEDA